MRPLSSKDRALLRSLLREVSRSFYLTLRVLPASLSDQIGLAYLLARATDTIADTDIISVEQRLAALRQLQERIRGKAGSVAFPEFQGTQTSDGERKLLESIDWVVSLKGSFTPLDQRSIERVLDTITSGQELDLRRFGSVKDVTALQTAEELDDYTYRVAGCVGEFWTEMCLRHLSPKPKIPEKELIALGVRFGKGLQLVNILRDIPADLKNRRCYIPEPELATVGLSPKDLLLSQNEPKARPVYDRWLFLAREHLDCGWRYVLALPPGWLRLRLACAWPILIGIVTADRLEGENPLDSTRRIKISRSEVKQIMRATLLALPFRRRWAALPKKFGRNVNQVAR